MPTFIYTFLYIHCFSFICEWVSAHSGQCHPVQVELGCIRSWQRASEQASWSVHVCFLLRLLYLYQDVSVCLNGCVWRSEVVGSPGVEVTDCCGLQCGRWDLNSGPLLSAGPSLLPSASVTAWVPALTLLRDGMWPGSVAWINPLLHQVAYEQFPPSDRTAHQDKHRLFHVRCTHL